MNEYGSRKTEMRQNVTCPSDNFSWISVYSLLNQAKGMKATIIDTAQIISSTARTVFLDNNRCFTGQITDKYFSVVAKRI